VAAILVGGFLVVQAAYYFWYFQIARFTAQGFRVPPIQQPGFALAVPLVLAAIYVFVPQAYRYARAFPIWLVLLTRGRADAWTRAFELAAPGLPSFVIAGFVWLGQRIAGDGGWALALTRARRFGDVEPLRRDGQVYLIFFWAFIGISILGKGIPGLGIAGVCCAAFVIFQNRWARLLDGRFEIKRGAVLLFATVIPWHVAMWFRDGPQFISEWIFTHNLNRAAAGVHGDRGTFDYCFGQVGYGMMVWAALVPMALAAAALVPAVNQRVARVRFLIATWAVVAAALFSLSQTKFHHYIFPAVPAMAILVALWLDDVLARRVRPTWVVGAFAAAVALMFARDMMWEEKQWIEMYIYRYDRPWPSAPPYGIDTSDAFLVIGLATAVATLLLGTGLRRLAVVALGATALGTALWAMHVYMPIAGTHWGMRDAVATYYRERHIYGQKLVYANPRQFADDWAPVIARRVPAWEFDTVIPDNFLDGQPMTVRIEVQGTTAGQAADSAFVARGTAKAVGPHTLRIDLAAGELGPIAAAVGRHKRDRKVRCWPRPRPGWAACPYRIVDADRLIAWQLYWRGENFWSGDEIWGPTPELKTALKETDNVAFLRYLKDPAIAPEGRKYYIVTESGRPATLKSILPTATARDTVEVINTTSNKFSLAVFQL
jgi:hypothetical protein